MNAAPVLPGISVVGLEAGLMYAYRAGWPVSTASIVQSGFPALALVVVGTVLCNRHRRLPHRVVLYESVPDKIGVTDSAAGKITADCENPP